MGNTVNNLILYADPNSKVEDFRAGLVLNICASLNHKSHEATLLVVTDPDLLRANLRESMNLVTEYPIYRYTNFELKKAGLTAMSLEEVSEDQRPEWEKEIQILNEQGQAKERRR